MDLRPLDGPIQNSELVTEGNVLKRETLTIFDQKPHEEDEVS